MITDTTASSWRRLPNPWAAGRAVGEGGARCPQSSATGGMTAGIGWRSSPRAKQTATPVALRAHNRQEKRGGVAALLAGGSARTGEQGAGARAPSLPAPPPRSAVSAVPLLEAVKSSHEDEIRAILEDAQASGSLAGMLDQRNLRRQAPLHLAAGAGRDGVVRMLLDHGAPVNIVDGRGETALHTAGANGHVPVVLLLLEHGAGVLSDPKGQTALHRAAHRGHAEAISVMLARDKPWFASFAGLFEAQDGSTPLHAATAAGHATVVNVILSSLSHDPTTVERLKTTKNRWGLAPASSSEREAPVMLTACVRETQERRKQALNDLQMQHATSSNDLAQSGRWCENPASAIKLPSWVERKLAQEASMRSKKLFESVQKELLTSNEVVTPALSCEAVDTVTLSTGRGLDADAEEIKADESSTTPQTIRKTSFHFVLLPDGEVNLECVYERMPITESGSAAEVAGLERAAHTRSAGGSGSLDSQDVEEELIDEDCEFEFNFDIMGGGWLSDEEWSDGDDSEH